MAIRKTGSRRIVVDGVAYRWRVRHKPTYMQGAYADGFVVSIEIAEDPGQVLLASAGARPDNWLERPGAAVTPARVAATIRAALTVGWKPTEPGSVFYIALSAEGQ
jgi:hypothetical protein